MQLLDTDTFTHLQNGHPRVVGNLLNSEDTEIGITIITKIEVLRGRMDFFLKAEDGSKWLRAQELLTLTEEGLAATVVYPVTEKAAGQFDRLRLNRSLRKIGRADLLIASIVLSHRATLVTRNLRHFKQIPGLSVINWVD